MKTDKSFVYQPEYVAIVTRRFGVSRIYTGINSPKGDAPVPDRKTAERILNGSKLEQAKLI